MRKDTYFCYFLNNNSWKSFYNPPDLSIFNQYWKVRAWSNLMNSNYLSQKQLALSDSVFAGFQSDHQGFIIIVSNHTHHGAFNKQWGIGMWFKGFF